MSRMDPVKADPVTDDDPIQPDSNLLHHARRELRIAGLDKPDSDYDGMLATAVLELIRVFADQGHSGYSAGVVADLFARLARYEPLTPLTYGPDEWVRHEGCGRDGGDLWQNTRKSSVFSTDGGATHYDLDDPEPSDD